MNSATIDRAIFQELQDSAGEEFAFELVDTFFEEAPPLLQQLADALAAGEADDFRRAAHSLKSNGMTFGATRFAEMARQLEHKGIGQVRNETPPPLAALAEEYARVVAALKDLRHA